jgi:hypothetical protein
MPLRHVSVFCGSHLGNRPSFAAAATGLGHALAARNIGLVYGGASVGLMGVVADAVVGAGGRAVGVITESLADHEIAHGGLTRLEVVRSMHERKARMAELSDAVIMLPGGFGTFEEFLESVTWVQLGLHALPSGILNVDGFFDGLFSFLAHAAETGFIRPGQVATIATSRDPHTLLEDLAHATSP